MSIENFNASVQYNDLKGTAAADNHDRQTLSHYLEAKGLIGKGDLVVAVKLWSGEVHATQQNQPVSVTAYVLPAAGYEDVQRALESDGPVSVKEVRFELDLASFFGLFKRFEIAITAYAGLNGRELRVED